MAGKVENYDEDSFIILGTSPGTSLDVKCNGLDSPLGRAQIEDAMKDLSLEAGMAFKAHFKLGDHPSPGSLMAASTIVTDDKSTEDLQKSFGELLDENVILKETLKNNNESMKEQFLLIASCQEDMMKTHAMHKEKFNETRELIEKLRQENKKLKLDMTKLTEEQSSSRGDKSGPSSALEFVTSPDDDVINKLTAQLALVETQRRQVIVENEKLTWQKESLEHIVDATSKERDDLKEKLKLKEMQLSTKDSDVALEINNYKTTVQDLQHKVMNANCALTSSISPEELTKRDMLLHQMEIRINALQNELKTAQLKIFEAENVKMEFSKHRSGASDTVKLYKEQIQDLNIKLKEAQTVVFQPVRISISPEKDAATEQSSLAANVKLYDRTLKHLADLLNATTYNLSDSVVQTLGTVMSLHDYKLDKTTVESFKSGLAELKMHLEKQHRLCLDNVGQVRGTLSIFEGIFKDYKEVLKRAKLDTNQPNIDALTNALVARGQEIQSLENELKALRNKKDDTELMKAQLDLYKSDFEAERESRQKMASEKETILRDLRTTQKRNQELLLQLEEVRKLNPNIFRSATATKTPLSRTAPPAPSAPSTPSAPAGPAQGGNGNATGNMVRKKKPSSVATKKDSATPNGGTVDKNDNNVKNENDDINASHVKNDNGEANGDANGSEAEDLPRAVTPPPPRFDCPVCDAPFKTLRLLQQHVDGCLL